MKYLAILLLVAVAAAKDLTRDRLDGQEVRLGRIEGKIHNYQKTFDEDTKAFKDAGETLDWLTDSVLELRGTRCAKGHVECLDTGECIDGLKVCDDIKDCRDGTDEIAKVCDLPFSIGDEFEGFLHTGNDCMFSGIETDFSITITLINKLTWFPQRPKVEARVVYKYSEDGSDTTGSYKVSGYYNPSRGVLNLAASDDDRTPGFVAQFGATSNKHVETSFKLRYQTTPCAISWIQPKE